MVAEITGEVTTNQGAERRGYTMAGSLPCRTARTSR